MPAPPEILIHVERDKPPIQCATVAEMDAVLDRMHVEWTKKVAAEEKACPQSLYVQVAPYAVSFGLGSEDTYLSVHPDSFDDHDGYFWTAVDRTKPSEGTDKMFYGDFNHDTYWCPCHLIPIAVARDAVRYFVEHQGPSPALEWEC